jgi:hypothetical protein
MTLLYAAPALLVCLFGLIVWCEHRERMRKLDIEFKELEIELEEMRKGNE